MPPKLVKTLYAIFQTQGAGVVLGNQVDVNHNSDLRRQKTQMVIPARLFAGAWTHFNIQEGNNGDNGVFFHDAVALFSKMTLAGGYSVRNQTRFLDNVIYGVFELRIDIYDPNQFNQVIAFLEEMQNGAIAIGSKRNDGHGRISFDFTVPYEDDTYNLVRDQLLMRHTENFTNNLPEPLRFVFIETPTAWTVMGNPTWQNGKRLVGCDLPLTETVEEIVERHLGLNLRRVLEVLAPDSFPVSTAKLLKNGLPSLPWTIESCANWRSRLDILVTLGMLFKAQGVENQTAVTAAAIIHVFLTGFKLTPENSGEWAALVDQQKARNVAITVDRKMREVWFLEQRAPSFQEVTHWVIDRFPELKYAQKRPFWIPIILK